MSKHLDRSTQLTLAITLALFVVALFEKGFTHDLLLEAAVFLVSAKLVLLSYKASVNNDAMAGQLAKPPTDSTSEVGQLREPPTPSNNLAVKVAYKDNTMKSLYSTQKLKNSVSSTHQNVIRRTSRYRKEPAFVLAVGGVTAPD